MTILYFFLGISWRWLLAALPLRTMTPTVSKGASCLAALFLSPVTIVIPVAHLLLLLWSLDASTLFSSLPDSTLKGCIAALTAVMAVLLGLVSIRRPRLTLDPTAVSLKGFGRRRYPLETLTVISKLEHAAPIHHSSGPLKELSNLTEAERSWLIPILQDAIDQRKRELTASGHDLTAPVTIPRALEKLTKR